MCRQGSGGANYGPLQHHSSAMPSEQAPRPWMHTPSWSAAPDEELQLDRLIEELAEIHVEEDFVLQRRLSQGMKEAEALLDTVDTEGKQLQNGMSVKQQDSCSSSRSPRDRSPLYWDCSQVPRQEYISEADRSTQLQAERERMRLARRRAMPSTGKHGCREGSRDRRVSEPSNGRATEAELHQREIMRAARRAADPKRRLRAERERMRAARRAMKIRGEGGIQTAIY